MCVCVYVCVRVCVCVCVCESMGLFFVKRNTIQTWSDFVSNYHAIPSFILVSLNQLLCNWDLKVCPGMNWVILLLGCLWFFLILIFNWMYCWLNVTEIHSSCCGWNTIACNSGFISTFSGAAAGIFQTLAHILAINVQAPVSLTGFHRN